MPKAERAKIKISQISAYSGRYAYGIKEDGLLELQNKIFQTGCFSRSDLCRVCDWKSPRSAGRARKNTDQEVREITAFALKTDNERFRIESLQLLQGVSYPTASVILHFFHSDPYPIMDFRAIWSLGMRRPSAYGFDYWWKYVVACRALLAKARQKTPRLTMRDLDRALWQYSKENQG